MNKLKLNLENCYGIKKLQKEIDFSQCKSYAIYAANGAMKSSLARTFKDLVDGVESRDRIFLNRETVRKITDENDKDLPSEGIYVIRPYEDENISHTEKTSTLLVDNKLREEYERLHIEIEKTKESFIKALKKQSGSKKSLETEICKAFANDRDEDFYSILIRLKHELPETALFGEVKYDIIFDDNVLEFLKTEDFHVAIEEYIKKYNELLDASKYFKKGGFNYYNAATIAKNLESNRFFQAKHTVNLNAGDDKLEIENQNQLEELIKSEKDSISNDTGLRDKFSKIHKLITNNQTLRSFEAYIGENEELLSELADVDNFKKEVLKSYLKSQSDLYEELIKKHESVEGRKNEIEDEARNQRTQWESVVEEFNRRFFVPFELTAENRVPVILGQEPLLNLVFTFQDGDDHALLKRDALIDVLSTGEKRAFYILNIIFEVEARKRSRQETLFIIDDIADSFDYKNKYAIVQYLQDIAEEPLFRQIILTHNFDFFRTANSRFIDYSHCLMALKTDSGISLEQATGIKNIFINEWKPKFFSDPKKKIASIPFIRNIIEFTRGDDDPDYIKLTSLVHWKSDSAKITEAELNSVYKSLFKSKEAISNGESLVIDTIQREAKSCLNDCVSINLENKIVLSIAIRLNAEKFMFERINDKEFLNNIEKNQTRRLFEKFKEINSCEHEAIKVIQRVLLMTPENIHLNAFMYEPIIDMSDDHLKSLYKDVSALGNS